VFVLAQFPLLFIVVQIDRSTHAYTTQTHLNLYSMQKAVTNTELCDHELG
jgi:hypothetical protein